MFAILGFLAAVVVMLGVTAVYILTFADSMGAYNIGGVPNSARVRVGVAVVGLVIGWLWYQLFHQAPFTVTFS